MRFTARPRIEHPRRARVFFAGRFSTHCLRGTARCACSTSGAAPANIASARQTCHERGLEDRVSFFCGDYLEFSAKEPFDLVVSDTTLHLIPRTDAALFGKIAADLAPGGRLVVSLPDACLYNRLLWSVRRVLRLVRGRWSDALILALAKLVFGKRFSEAMLRERLIYMYILPERFDSPAFRRMLEKEHGLAVVKEIAEPFVAGKANHRILVLTRRAAA
ncbi:MAG: class I SAM-dependent methyltransferase [Chthoniobacteraceae bacterium]